MAAISSQMLEALRDVLRDDLQTLPEMWKSSAMKVEVEGLHLLVDIITKGRVSDSPQRASRSREPQKRWTTYRASYRETPQQEMKFSVLNFKPFDHLQYSKLLKPSFVPRLEQALQYADEDDRKKLGSLFRSLVSVMNSRRDHRPSIYAASFDWTPEHKTMRRCRSAVDPFRSQVAIGSINQYCFRAATSCGTSSPSLVSSSPSPSRYSRRAQTAMPSSRSAAQLPLASDMTTPSPNRNSRANLLASSVPIGGKHTTQLVTESTYRRTYGDENLKLKLNQRESAYKHILNRTSVIGNCCSPDPSVMMRTDSTMKSLW
eukprot:GILK01002994.1.p1 GENE.GILK01002994.1~~GILK01002994.1.p1  ORF type:complete len:330 (-),score=53.73 GILK01002994.1:173-1123(-)